MEKHVTDGRNYYVVWAVYGYDEKWRNWTYLRRKSCEVFYEEKKDLLKNIKAGKKLKMRRLDSTFIFTISKKSGVWFTKKEKENNRKIGLGRIIYYCVYIVLYMRNA